MKNTQEIPVTFKSSSKLLRGFLHKPTSLKEFPAIVLCHGYFQSNKIGPLALYVQLARSIANQGIACLRFDYAGFGESEGDYLNASLRSMTVDLKNAIEFIKDYRGVDSAKLGVIGHSLGGNIGLHVTSTESNIKLLCMLSPNTSNKDSNVKIFSSKEMKEMYETGITLRKGIPALINVYEQINSGLSFEKAKQVKAKSLIIYGDHDPYYKHDDYVRFSKAFKILPEIHSIKDADHNFLPVASRIDLTTKIITWVRRNYKYSNMDKSL